MRTILALVLAGSLWPIRVDAQVASGRPEGYPDARTFVREFVERPDMSAPSWSVRGCPDRVTPWQDSVRAELLALPPDPEIIAQLHRAWGGALSRCQDPRLDRWYRDYLASTPTIGGVDLLMTHRTPENVEAVIRLSMDTTKGEWVRENALWILLEDLTEPERAAIMLDFYDRDGRLPPGFLASSAAMLHISDGQGPLWRSMLPKVRSDPSRPLAPWVLRVLADHASQWSYRGQAVPWAAELISTAREIERLPESAVPPRTRATAAAALAWLSQRGIQ